MGADLYLDSVFRPNIEQYKPLFDKWVQRRDELQKAGDEAEAKNAQGKVEEYYELMYDKGYFRDSYNASNLLRRFELSWWADIGDMLDEDGKLSPTHAQALLELLRQREPVFEESLHEPIDWGEWSEAEVVVYFREKYQKFKAFLEEAIRLNEKIICSI
jgi:hypothetical protein